MKLNKDTRNLVKVGTVMNDGSWDGEITNVIHSGKGLKVTIKLLTGRFAGRTLYAEPLSTYYGCEIVKV